MKVFCRLLMLGLFSFIPYMLEGRGNCSIEQQSKQSILYDGTVWTVAFVSPYDGETVLSYKESKLYGDTIIDGMPFRQRVDRYRASTEADYGEYRPTGVFLGQDGDRVYCFDKAVDEAPRLIMDFSATEGDIIEYPSPEDDVMHTVSMKVVTVSDTIIAAIPRKCVHVEEASSSESDVWIEGIGSCNYGIEPYYSAKPTGAIPRLYEVTEDGIVIYKLSWVSNRINAMQALSRNAPVFDLSGRRVQGEPQKGVYVSCGRKYVLR